MTRDELLFRRDDLKVCRQNSLETKPTDTGQVGADTTRQGTRKLVGEQDHVDEGLADIANSLGVRRKVG